MSLGIPIEIPGTGLVFIPFNHLQNDEFPSILQDAIVRANMPDDIINKQNINVVVIELTKFLRTPDAANAFACLKHAGNMWKLLAKFKPVTNREYADNLVRLQRAIKFAGKKHDDTGYDQIIARLLYMMQFEDPIATYDSYALWIEDIEGNEHIFD